MVSVEAVTLGVVGLPRHDGCYELLYQFGGHLPVAIYLDEDVGTGFACMGHPFENRVSDAGVLVLVEHGYSRVRHVGFDMLASALRTSIVNNDNPCDFRPDAGKHLFDLVNTAIARDDDRDIRTFSHGPVCCDGWKFHDRLLRRASAGAAVHVDRTAEHVRTRLG